MDSYRTLVVYKNVVTCYIKALRDLTEEKVKSFEEKKFKQ